MMMRSCHPWEEPNTGDHNQADFLGEPVLKISTADEKSKEYGETPNATVLFFKIILSWILRLMKFYHTYLHMKIFYISSK